MVERYRVGLAPDGWDGLTRGAQGRGYTADELVTAGLALRARNSGNLIDHFRSRLMFPIADTRGRVVSQIPRNELTIERLTADASGGAVADA